MTLPTPEQVAREWLAGDESGTTTVARLARMIESRDAQHAAHRSASAPTLDELAGAIGGYAHHSYFRSAPRARQEKLRGYAATAAGLLGVTLRGETVAANDAYTLKEPDIVPNNLADRVAEARMEIEINKMENAAIEEWARSTWERCYPNGAKWADMEEVEGGNKDAHRKLIRAVIAAMPLRPSTPSPPMPTAVEFLTKECKSMDQHEAAVATHICHRRDAQWKAHIESVSPSPKMVSKATRQKVIDYLYSAIASTPRIKAETVADVVAELTGVSWPAEPAQPKEHATMPTYGEIKAEVESNRQRLAGEIAVNGEPLPPPTASEQPATDEAEVERIAKVVQASCAGPIPWGELLEVHRETRRNQARAVLAAIPRRRVSVEEARRVFNEEPEGRVVDGFAAIIRLCGCEPVAGASDDVKALCEAYERAANAEPDKAAWPVSVAGIRAVRDAVLGSEKK